MPESLRAAMWPLVLGTVTVVRLVLTHDRDILAMNEPYDDFWFVGAADRGIWQGPYHHMVFAQLQMQALWLRLANGLGIPLRLAVDAAWLAGAAYLAFAMRRFCRRRWPALLAFCFLALHPYSIVLFDRAFAENIMTSVVTIAIAAMLDVWNYRAGGERPSPRRQTAATILGAVALGIAFHTRKEGLIVLVPILVLAAGSLVGWRTWWSATRWRATARVVVAPLLAILAIGLALASANAAVWGVFARYELAAPQYLRAIHALNAIDPGAPTPRLVTVTAATRARAYAVSPTFRQLQPYLDGPMASAAVRMTELYTGVKGEIGNGWFYWALRDTANAAGWHRSAPFAESRYKAMADEIEAAFARDALPRRRVLLPFLDPDWSKWLPVLPASMVAELRQAVAIDPRDLQLAPEDATEVQEAMYLSVAGRRRPFFHPSLIGWLVAPPGTKVGIGDEPASAAMLPLEGKGRPDVPGAISFRLRSDDASGTSTFFVTAGDGTSARVRLADLAVGRVFPMTPLTATLGVDGLVATPAPRLADGWLAPWCMAWSAMGVAGALAGVVALVFGTASNPDAGVARMILVALACGILARVTLFAMLDSSAWTGTQARYLLPNVPLLGTFGAIALWRLLRRPGMRTGRRPAVLSS